MSNVLCITGMHRSGTSLVASWLERCGLTLHDGRVLGPDTGNPKGHFEDGDFFDLHASAIRSMDRRSDGWKVTGDGFPGFRGGDLERAQELAGMRSGKYSLWGWKDPRSVFFLEQWKGIIPDLKALIIWRPCDEVCASLARRSRAARTTLTESVRMWASHNRKACEYKQNHPADTLLMPLDQVINNDRACIDALNDKLRLGLRYTPISAVYDSGLLHKKTPFIARSASLITGLYYGTGRAERTLRALSDTA